MARAQELGAKTLEVAASRNGGLEAGAILKTLAGEGLTRVYCEGGGGLAAALLGADLVDQLVVFQAGMAIGAEGRPALGAMGLARLGDAQRFDLVSTRVLGPDTVTVWRKPQR